MILASSRNFQFQFQLRFYGKKLVEFYFNNDFSFSFFWKTLQEENGVKIVHK